VCSYLCLINSIVFPNLTTQWLADSLTQPCNWTNRVLSLFLCPARLRLGQTWVSCGPRNFLCPQNRDSVLKTEFTSYIFISWSLSFALRFGLSSTTLFYLRIFWLVCNNANDRRRWLAVTENWNYSGPSALQSQVKREDSLSRTYLSSCWPWGAHPIDISQCSCNTLCSEFQCSDNLFLTYFYFWKETSRPVWYRCVCVCVCVCVL
jgi:hypothetical protein